MPIGNISPRQFGTRPAPMPTGMPKRPGGVMGTRPAPMPTTIGGIGGASNGSGTRPAPMPTRIFGR